MHGEPLVILPVEDNADHAELVLRSFRRHRVANDVHHVDDGAAALECLFGEGRFADPRSSPRPHVVLLDLRLPRVDGLEVLSRIKGDDGLRTIPVVVLTTSDAESDLARAYAYHANSYLVKPIDFEKFTALMDDMGFYWLAWNRRP